MILEDAAERYRDGPDIISVLKETTLRKENMHATSGMGREAVKAAQALHLDVNLSL